MKKGLFILLLLAVSCANPKEDYKAQIQNYQYELNTYYGDVETSPLTTEDLINFKSLPFFEINETYKVTANFERTPDAPVFEMRTTTDRLAKYRKYGVATFNLNGKKHKLSLYQNQDYMDSEEYGHLLFLPFTDLTNGKESYSGGRFLDIEIPNENASEVIIDFNNAYNPYCAYNKKYSCPIP
ncbi:MAG TPA: DUF1684 domain-containing protein, partial [Flavobacteriaceae bacterium]|nr:DUF1684 domain-containing protein [Flavobacteriaceae bacterium]